MGKKDKADHGTKDISARLKELEDWDDTEEDSGFKDFPKRSTQQIKFEKASVGEVKSNPEKIQITLESVVASGEFKGRKLYSRLGLTDPEQRARTRGTLAKLGIDWPKASKLPGVVAELEGTFAQATVAAADDGGMPACWINKAIDEDDITEDEDEDTEDEKPKKKAKDEDDDDEKPKKKGKSESDDDEDEDDDEKPVKKAKKKDDDDDDDDEEDDDEEDEAPKKKKKAADEDEDDDEKPAKKKKADDDEDDEDDKVECGFADEDLDEDQIEKIKKLAKKNDFKAKQYTSMTDLLGDIAEFKGVSGKFKSYKKLMAALKEAETDDDE